MKKELRTKLLCSTVLIAFLAKITSCNTPANLLLSDLELVAVTLLDESGVSPSTMTIQQGARTRFTAMVHINNLLTPGNDDTFDRRTLAVRLTLKNTSPDDKDTSDSLEEYTETITYDPGIGYVPPDGPPFMAIELDDIRATNIDVLAPLMEESLTFPEGLDGNSKLLDDHLAYQRDKSYLDEVGLADFARKVRGTHVPRMRYVQAQFNNHYNGAPAYLVTYTDTIAGRIARATYIVFTFEVPSHQLKRGQWELQIEADPDDVIEEPTNSNNASDAIAVELVEPIGDGGDWGVGETGPEEFYYADCDMVIGQPDDYGPALLRAKYRSPDEGAELPYWEDNHVLDINQQRMRISEFWGPEGNGQYWDGSAFQAYYSLPLGGGGDGALPRPQPEEIENVIILAAGYAQCNDINIVTGQPGCGQVEGYEDGCEGGANYLCDHSGIWEVLYTSIAARIILNQPSYADLYSDRNTLLTMVNQHEYDMALCGGCWWDSGLHCAGCDEDAYQQMRDAWVDYIKARTDNLVNVKVIILAGQSRGGVFCAKMADEIKGRLLAGGFRNQNPIRIVVATNAAANTEADEGLGTYTNWDLGDWPTWGSNAHYHDLAEIWTETSRGLEPDTFPLYWRQLIDDGISDKPFIYCARDCYGNQRPEYEDERVGSLNGDASAIESFYTQAFANMSHTSIRVEYRTENGPDQLRFIFDKAWSTDDDRVRFFDFEMAERYGFAEYDCE